MSRDKLKISQIKDLNTFVVSAASYATSAGTASYATTAGTVSSFPVPSTYYAIGSYVAGYQPGSAEIVLAGTTFTGPLHYRSGSGEIIANTDGCTWRCQGMTGPYGSNEGTSFYNHLWIRIS